MSTTKPPAQADQIRELTWQSIVGAFFISFIVAGSYPYVVLKLGMGPNVSVVAAFIGAIFLNITARKTRGRNRFMNNIIQTAGTSAAMTAFMCIVLAAFGFLEKNETVDIHMNITPWATFTWLSCSGMIGVVFTVLFRKHFVDDPKMIFADGVAAAETITVLDSDPKGAKDKSRVLGITAVLSAIVDWFREGMPYLRSYYFSRPYRAGFEPNLLNIGTGLLLGINVGVSMLLGTFVVAYIVGPWVVSSGIGLDIVRGQIAPQYWDMCQQYVAAATPTAEQTQFLADHCSALPAYTGQRYFATVLLWVMWPATGMMVASAVTAVALRWRSIVDTFKNLRMSQNKKTAEDMSLKAILVWAAILTVALAFIQRAHFGMSVVQTVVAVLASLPLMLVGIRVLGETNNGPISLMSNALQAVFAVFWPAHIGLNLVAAGMAGSTSAQSEGTIQDYKAGKLIGSTPRILTYVQMAAVPIGAAAVAIMYPLLVKRYGLGGEGLTAPTGIKLANMAVLLSKGFSALPKYALTVTVIAVIAGIVIEILKDRVKHNWVNWIPSVAAFGFALILPGELNIPMGIGAILGWIWSKQLPASYEKYAITAAAGFIAGEALLGGLVLPILAAMGISFG